MYYSFHNSGTVYFFKPGKPAYDIRDGVKRSALEFHTKLVNEANRFDVFICDDHGNMIIKNDAKPSDPKPTHIPFAKWKKLEKARWDKWRTENKKNA